MPELVNEQQQGEQQKDAAAATRPENAEVAPAKALYDYTDIDYDESGNLSVGEGKDNDTGYALTKTRSGRAFGPAAGKAMANFGDGVSVLGMPLAYGPLDDPNSRVYSDTFERNLPVVFLHPGKPLVNSKLFGGGADGGGWFNLGPLNKPLNALGNLASGALRGNDGWRDNRWMSFRSNLKEYFDFYNTLARNVYYALDLPGDFTVEDAIGYDNAPAGFGIPFYTTKGSDVSESASNEYTQSEIARETNDKQQAIRDRKLLANAGGSIPDMMGHWISELVKGIANLPVIGGLVGALTENLDGSQMYYPDIWQNSTFDRSYSLEFKFYSPYGDPESIFHSVYLPFLGLLTMALPLQDSYYSYTQPFIVRASCPGVFECEMGVIRSISIERGGDKTFTRDNLPREITVRMTLSDMYPNLLLSRSQHLRYNYALASYIECLAGLKTDATTIADRNERRKKVLDMEMKDFTSLRGIRRRIDDGNVNRYNPNDPRNIHRPYEYDSSTRNFRRPAGLVNNNPDYDQ